MNGMHNNDDFITLFEQRLCEYTSAPYAVVVDRCTNAILLSLEYFRLAKHNGCHMPVTVPAHTFLSVPMTLMNYGYGVTFRYQSWYGSYQIGETGIYDCAVGFTENMYTPGQIQCLSFQQKKRLAIGKGGAILTDNEEMATVLQRMRSDGRDPSIPVRDENPDDIIMGYHMNMSPDEAARGVLLLNQLSSISSLAGWANYPDISKFRCFEQ